MMPRHIRLTIIAATIVGASCAIHKPLERRDTAYSDPDCARMYTQHRARVAKMTADELRRHFRKLAAEVIAAERKLELTNQALSQAEKQYNSADAESKLDALVHLTEAQVANRVADYQYNQVERLLDQAQQAYFARLIEEAKWQPYRELSARLEQMIGKSAVLSRDEAAIVAAKLANKECSRLFRRTPFSPSDYPAVLIGSRWHWGRHDPAGIRGYSAGGRSLETGDRRLKTGV